MVGGWWIGLEVQPQDLGTLQSSSWINLCISKYSRVTREDLWEPKLGWNSHSRRQWFKSQSRDLCTESCAKTNVLQTSVPQECEWDNCIEKDGIPTLLGYKLLLLKVLQPNESWDGRVLQALILYIIFLNHNKTVKAISVLVSKQIIWKWSKENTRSH